MAYRKQIVLTLVAALLVLMALFPQKKAIQQAEAESLQFIEEAHAEPDPLEENQQSNLGPLKGIELAGTGAEAGAVVSGGPGISDAQTPSPGVGDYEAPAVSNAGPLDLDPNEKDFTNPDPTELQSLPDTVVPSHQKMNNSNSGPSSKSNLQANLKSKSKEKSNDYTIQLITVSNEQNLKSFMKTHNLKDKAHYIKKNNGSGSQYVLLYGRFPDKQKAMNALEKLPLTLKNAKPWVRKIGDVEAS